MFFLNNFSLNLVQIHEKNLLNLLKHDLIFDIVFELNFDHYLDQIPILIQIKSSYFIKEKQTRDKSR